MAGRGTKHQNHLTVVSHPQSNRKREIVQAGQWERGARREGSSKQLGVPLVRTRAFLRPGSTTEVTPLRWECRLNGDQRRDDTVEINECWVNDGKAEGIDRWSTLLFFCDSLQAFEFATVEIVKFQSVRLNLEHKLLIRERNFQMRKDLNVLGNIYSDIAHSCI